MVLMFSLRATRSVLFPIVCVLFYSLIFSLVFSLSPSLSFASPSDATADQILDKFYRTTQPPGLSISVAKNGEIVWRKGLGYADVEQKVMVSPEASKFRIASVAKTFTGYALVKLAAEGRLDLDAEVQQYVPTFPKKSKPITVRQVAAHVSGIRHYKSQEAFSNVRYDNIRDGLAIFQNDPLKNAPGDRWLYSSYGYNLLGVVIENITQQPLEKYMISQVFTPIGMLNTVGDDKRRIIPFRGKYYKKTDDKLVNEIDVDTYYKLAAGGFLSTTDDMARFGIAMLSKHTSSEQRTTMWTPYKTNKGKTLEYGIGWSIKEDDDGNQWLGHGGGIIGGTSNFWVLPKDNLVLAVASNQTNLDYGSLLIELREYFVSQVVKD